MEGGLESQRGGGEVKEQTRREREREGGSRERRKRWRKNGG